MIRLSDINRIILPPSHLAHTVVTLQSYGQLSREGMVLWAARLSAGIACICETIVPEQISVSSIWGLSVTVPGHELHRINVYLHQTGLRLIAQIHAHPDEAYHSEVDESFPIVTELGSLSIVLPNFAQSSPSISDWAIYRLHIDGWKSVSEQDALSLFRLEECNGCC